MKVIRNLLIIAVAAGLGLAFGFLWRGRSQSKKSNHSATAAADGAPSILSKFTVRQRGVPTAADDSPLATQLARDLSMTAGVTRWLYWMEALEKATPADFPRLARLAAGNSIATRLVAVKWVDVNPEHMFDHILTLRKNGGTTSVSELVSVLMEEWPKRDLDGAIAAMNGTNDLALLRGWRMQMASAAFDKDVERGLRLFSEWNVENYSPRMTAVAKWAAANPQHAAEFTLANPAGYASQSVIETVAKEWAKSDPAGALAYAASQSGNLAGILARTALKDWAGRDLQAAGQWLGNADAATREKLSAPFVEAWAKTDANSALSWCESNLTGSSQSRAVAAVMTGMASKNASGAAELVLNMNPSSARSAAAGAVAEKWFPSYGSDKPVPKETMAWIAKLDADSSRQVLERTQWRWAESDPKAMAAFLATLNPEQVPGNSYNSLARSFARKSPLDAMDWSNQVPQDRRTSVAADAFSEWQQSQPDAARKWLIDLSSSDARREPLLQNAISSMAYAADAITHLSALNANDRATAQKVIENMSHMPDERRARLLEALKSR